MTDVEIDKSDRYYIVTAELSRCREMLTEARFYLGGINKPSAGMREFIWRLDAYFGSLPTYD